MRQATGPGAPFETLFDEQPAIGQPLDAAFGSIYGRWALPEVGERPYTYINFVTSRDGRVSFNEPGKSSGGPISGNSRHDRWLMALLRARADAVLIGASALAYAPRQTWSAGAIFPDDEQTWKELRQVERRAPLPLHVVVTRSGEVRAESPVITDPNVPALIVSTDAGIRKVREQIGEAPNVALLELGASIDYQRLGLVLAHEHHIRTLLSEAGPQVYAALLQAGVVHDEFITLSPIIVGSSSEKPRPGLAEGVAFAPDEPPRSRLLSVRRAGDLLFLHSRYQYEP